MVPSARAPMSLPTRRACSRVSTSACRRKGTTSRVTGTPRPDKALDRPLNEASEMIRAMVGAPHKVKFRIFRSPLPETAPLV